MTDRQFYGDRTCIEVPRSRGEGLRLSAYSFSGHSAPHHFEYYLEDAIQLLE